VLWTYKRIWTLTLFTGQFTCCDVIKLSFDILTPGVDVFAVVAVTVVWGDVTLPKILAVEFDPEPVNDATVVTVITVLLVDVVLLAWQTMHEMRVAETKQHSYWWYVRMYVSRIPSLNTFCLRHLASNHVNGFLRHRLKCYAFHPTTRPSDYIVLSVSAAGQSMVLPRHAHSSLVTSLSMFFCL